MATYSTRKRTVAGKRATIRNRQARAIKQGATATNRAGRAK